MRIFQAIRYHYNKHKLDYGIISFILTVPGAVFIPQIMRWLYEMTHHSFGWTLGLGLGYSVLLVVIALPMCQSVAWIFDRGGKE